MRKPRAFLLDVVPFQHTTAVFAHCNQAQIMQHARRLRVKPESLAKLEESIRDWDYEKGYVHGMMIPLPQGNAVLLRHRPDRPPRHIVGTVIHEMTHVVQHVLRQCETPLVSETDEVYAYLTEYLVSETLKRIGL